MQDLHQSARGNGANSSASRGVCHHSHDLWTPSRGRVYSQGLLWEAEHVRVRITAGHRTADVIFGDCPQLNWEPSLLNDVFSLQGSGEHNQLWPNAGSQCEWKSGDGQNMLRILTYIAVVKWLTEGWVYFLWCKYLQWAVPVRGVTSLVGLKGQKERDLTGQLLNSDTLYL